VPMGMAKVKACVPATSATMLIRSPFHAQMTYKSTQKNVAIRAMKPQ
jgi:hypothetical protein